LTQKRASNLQAGLVNLQYKRPALSFVFLLPLVGSDLLLFDQAVPSRRVTVVFAYGKAMVLISIFRPGEMDRNSNKDGTNYNQNRP
jgi:hypothetical protein